MLCSCYIDYYTVTNDTPEQNQLFNEDDICLILKMKTGIPYTRWMGTIPVSHGATKCVVLTTLSGKYNILCIMRLKTTDIAC